MRDMRGGKMTHSIHTRRFHQYWARCLALAQLAHAATALHVAARPGYHFHGVEVTAAGIIPYTVQPGGRALFLLQHLQNGTRANLLSDFGGRREDTDSDVFATAAREFSEETNGVFGDPAAVAMRLRREVSVRILNRNSRYLTFFIKVDPPAGAIAPVDHTSTDGPTARECQWLRADELMRETERGTVLARLTNERRSNPAASAEQGATSLHRAILKTLSVENVHPDAHERWEATVLPTLARPDDEVSDPWARKVRSAPAAKNWQRKGGKAATPAVAVRRGGGSHLAGKRGSRRGGYRKPAAGQQLPAWRQRPSYVDPGNGWDGVVYAP